MEMSRSRWESPDRKFQADRSAEVLMQDSTVSGIKGRAVKSTFHLTFTLEFDPNSKARDYEK